MADGSLAHKPTVDEINGRLHAVGCVIADARGGLPVVERHSHPWLAWYYWRKKHGLPVRFMAKRERWTVPVEYPPTDLRALEMNWQAEEARARAFGRDQSFTPIRRGPAQKTEADKAHVMRRAAEYREILAAKRAKDRTIFRGGPEPEEIPTAQKPIEDVLDDLAKSPLQAKRHQSKPGEAIKRQLEAGKAE